MQQENNKVEQQDPLHLREITHQPPRQGDDRNRQTEDVPVSSQELHRSFTCLFGLQPHSSAHVNAETVRAWVVTDTTKSVVLDRDLEEKRRSPASQNRRASAARSAAGRPSRAGRPARVLARLLCCTPAPTFRQKDMEIRRRRLAGKLAHHQCDLTSMVSGMVCQMLHQVRQSDFGCAEREHSL